MMLLSFFGIIMVVLGHTGDPIRLASDIFPYYSFHMALFIFISGYFYNPQNENKLWGKNGYLLKKVKKLVIPYFIWNVIYGIIVTILRKLNVISYGVSINFRSLFISPWLGGHQYMLNLASWFLLALFLVSIIYILIRKLASMAKIWNDVLALFFFLIISIVSIFFAQKDISQYYLPLLRTGFFLFFYQLGYVYKTKIEGKFKINNVIYFLILILVQIIFIKLEGKVPYTVVFMEFENKILITPIIVSITGILFWLKISEILVPALGKSKIVNYISNYTYDIMLHHLFVVFMLNLLIWKLSPILNLEGFSVERFKSTIYYCYTAGIAQSQIIYSIAAIFLPLVFRFLYEKLQKLLHRKFKDFKKKEEKVCATV